MYYCTWNSVVYFINKLIKITTLLHITKHYVFSLLTLFSKEINKFPTDDALHVVI